MSEGRVCTKCGEYKLASHFHKHSGCSGGINTVCKDCRKPVSKMLYKTTTLEYRMWHASKSRAKRKGIPHSILLVDVVIPEFCPVLGCKLQAGHHLYAPSLDRIVPELGYVKGNICVISNKANMIKSSASVDEIGKVYKWLSDKKDAEPVKSKQEEYEELVRFLDTWKE